MIRFEACPNHQADVRGCIHGLFTDGVEPVFPRITLAMVFAASSAI
jgi:hypothetical protein